MAGRHTRSGGGNVDIAASSGDKRTTREAAAVTNTLGERGDLRVEEVSISAE